MTKFLSTLVLVLGVSLAFCQNSTEGTFQLMTTNVKAQEVFSTNILALIESARLEDHVAVIKVGDFTWVRILSENTINHPDFEPLTDLIIEIDPDDELIQTGTSVSNETNN